MAEEKIHFSLRCKDFCAILFIFYLFLTTFLCSHLTENHSWTLLWALYNISKPLSPVENKGTNSLIKVCPSGCRNAVGKPGDTELGRRVTSARTFLSEKLFLASEVRISFPWAECLMYCELPYFECVVGFPPPHSTDWNWKFSIVL